jgi:hypothetical protein
MLAVDKCAYPEDLASVMGPMLSYTLREPRHTSRISDDRISGPDGTGNWNPRITSRG